MASAEFGFASAEFGVLGASSMAAAAIDVPFSSRPAAESAATHGFDGKARQWVRAANAGQHSRPSHPRLNPSDTTINFQGCPAHQAGQRGSHKPATAVVGSYYLIPALPTHERPSRRDAGHRRDRASPHPTPVSTLHALGACVSTTAWAAASPARGPPFSS